MIPFLYRHLPPIAAGVVAGLWYGILIALVILCALAPSGTFSYLRL